MHFPQVPAWLISAPRLPKFLADLRKQIQALPQSELRKLRRYLRDEQYLQAQGDWMRIHDEIAESQGARHYHHQIKTHIAQQLSAVLECLEDELRLTIKRRSRLLQAVRRCSRTAGVSKIAVWYITEMELISRWIGNHEQALGPYCHDIEFFLVPQARQSVIACGQVLDDASVHVLSLERR